MFFLKFLSFPLSCAFKLTLNEHRKTTLLLLFNLNQNQKTISLLLSEINGKIMTNSNFWMTDLFFFLSLSLSSERNLECLKPRLSYNVSIVQIINRLIVYSRLVKTSFSLQCPWWIALQWTVINLFSFCKPCSFYQPRKDRTMAGG